MYRELKKDVKEFNKKFRYFAFYASDLQQIYEMAKNGPHKDFLFNIIELSLKAGFVIGHRYAARGADGSITPNRNQDTRNR